MQQTKTRFQRLTAIILATALLLTISFTTVRAEERPNPYAGGWSNCTWSAWELARRYLGVCMPRMGNAGEWYGNAAAFGYPVGQTPAPGSILVLSNHVMYISEVSGNNVYSMEGGYNGGYHEGWVRLGSTVYGQAFLGFIYLADVPPDTAPTGKISEDDRAKQQQELEELRAKKANLQEQISDIEADIQTTQNQVAKLNGMLANRSRAVYELGILEGALEMLFTGEGNFVENFAQAVSVLDNDVKMMNQYNRELSHLEKKMGELVEKRSELEKVNVD